MTDSAIQSWQSSGTTPLGKRAQPYRPRDLYSKGEKRMKFDEGKIYTNRTSSTCWREKIEQGKPKVHSKFLHKSDPFAITNFLEGLDSGKFGSVTQEIKELLDRRQQLLNTFYAIDPTLPYKCLDMEKKQCSEIVKVNEQPAAAVIDLDDAENISTPRVVAPAHLLSSDRPVVILDSDDEDVGTERPYFPYQEVTLKDPTGKSLNKDKDLSRNESFSGKIAALAGGTEVNNKGEYVGVQDDTESEEDREQFCADDGLTDIWNEMNFALETTKDTAAEPSSDQCVVDGGEECEHSFILKDDIGYVCRICGVIQRSIETIIEFQYTKGTKNTRTYWYDGRTSKDLGSDEILLDGIRSSHSHEFAIAEISAHPRHKKQMKPHQVEGFNFLHGNLVTENPGGCIMAHAPGSGKTFMIISFLQSFMAKYPFSRPLVVLPKGIIATWKREFQRWQVEDFPLYDFYSVKADNRSQQLEVLKQWADERSILFLGYKQFSTIVCDNDNSKVAAACQEILLTCPSILILDEGHTPRNQDTDILTSLEKVKTPRKVVLSGTLYQNHVKEVFNILNLVRPKFLKLDTSKAIKRRILSRAPISTRKNLIKKGSDGEFYEIVEHTLLKDDNYQRKITVIKDLREMTSKVLHYYKGDFLDELPGLVDFTVLLKLSPRQRSEVAELKMLGGRKFKISSQGSAIYVHPLLKALSKNNEAKDRVDEHRIDLILENLDERDGVKTKFFLNLLQLCESRGEKMLVFSQYLLPLKFLERLTVKIKGYTVGREIFMITGDSDADTREYSMEKFNTSADARVFFGSIRACGEGISLVGASRILILDVHLNPSVTRQAIGRAFRPGQVRKVYTYRLIASCSPEEEDHTTCFRKESIAKMWFEWNEYFGTPNFEMEPVDVKECGDLFLETPRLSEDVVAVFKR